MRFTVVSDLTLSLCLTLILLTWRIWRAPNNASKWQMGFNSAFKGLMLPCSLSNTEPVSSCSAMQDYLFYFFYVYVLLVACWPLVPKFAGSNPAEAVGFLGRKNPQHAFLRRGSKAVGPMS